LLGKKGYVVVVVVVVVVVEGGVHTETNAIH